MSAEARKERKHVWHKACGLPVSCQSISAPQRSICSSLVFWVCPVLFPDCLITRQEIPSLLHCVGQWADGAQKRRTPSPKITCTASSSWKAYAARTGVWKTGGWDSITMAARKGQPRDQLLPTSSLWTAINYKTITFQLRLYSGLKPLPDAARWAPIEAGCPEATLAICFASWYTYGRQMSSYTSYILICPISAEALSRTSLHACREKTNTFQERTHQQYRYWGYIANINLSIFSIILIQNFPSHKSALYRQMSSKGRLFKTALQSRGHAYCTPSAEWELFQLVLSVDHISMTNHKFCLNRRLWARHLHIKISLTLERWGVVPLG